MGPNHVEEHPSKSIQDNVAGKVSTFLFRGA